MSNLFRATIIWKRVPRIILTVNNLNACKNTCTCTDCEHFKNQKVWYGELRVISANMASFRHKTGKKGKQKGTPYVIMRSTDPEWEEKYDNTNGKYVGGAHWTKYAINGGIYQFTEEQYREMMECFSPGSTK